MKANCSFRHIIKYKISLYYNDKNDIFYSIDVGKCKYPDGEVR